MASKFSILLVRIAIGFAMADEDVTPLALQDSTLEADGECSGGDDCALNAVQRRAEPLVDSTLEDSAGHHHHHHHHHWPYPYPYPYPPASASGSSASGSCQGEDQPCSEDGSKGNCCSGKFCNLCQLTCADTHMWLSRVGESCKPSNLKKQKPEPAQSCLKQSNRCNTKNPDNGGCCHGLNCAYNEDAKYDICGDFSTHSDSCKKYGEKCDKSSDCCQTDGVHICNQGSWTCTGYYR
eukprot:TRINITY_DN113679_c0_g1_i1.p1 TRINITY_DN113679_c0_g1~~TRINITY_DN113679_c0_g1_i1.p1  ORF type:complete len:237 (+),score=30.39 TRINITY_DN113679_c0_g1_i1:54-764(+)